MPTPPQTSDQYAAALAKRMAMGAALLAAVIFIGVTRQPPDADAQEYSDSDCRHFMAQAIDGRFDSDMPTTAHQCKAQIAPWAAQYRTEYTLTGSALRVGPVVYSLDGVTIERVPYYLQVVDTQLEAVRIYGAGSRPPTTLIYGTPRLADKVFDQLAHAVAAGRMPSTQTAAADSEATGYPASWMNR
jgi:hypothetical protein